MDRDLSWLINHDHSTTLVYQAPTATSWVSVAFRPQFEDLSVKTLDNIADKCLHWNTFHQSTVNQQHFMSQKASSTSITLKSTPTPYIRQMWPAIQHWDTVCRSQNISPQCHRPQRKNFTLHDKYILLLSRSYVVRICFVISKWNESPF